MSYEWRSVLPYSCQQLLDLILDIESYPQFIPFCRGVQVKDRCLKELTAELITSHGWSFTSRVVWAKDTITIIHDEFLAKWGIERVSKGSLVLFQFTFVCPHFTKKYFLNHAVAFLAPQVIAAFTKRAHFLYRPSLAPR